MIVLAGLALAALAIWVYLAAGHARFWRTDVELPPALEPSFWPDAAILVPARNEVGVLPLSLPSILAQDYPGCLTIILIDDRSADGTAALARDIAGASPRRLTVLAGTDPPPGWAGKLWALQQGLDALRTDAPQFVLFTDADIAHPPDSLRRLVAAAMAGNLDLVSLMARLPAQRRWERLLIPAFVYFFAQLYPFHRVNGPHARTAAAAGGCVLARLSALEAAGGLERIRGAVIDDVSLAALVKRAGGHIWLGLAHEVRSCRPYTHLAEIWGMVARSAFTQLRHSYLLLGLTVTGLLLVYALPPAALLTGVIALVLGAGPSAAVTAGAGAAAWAIMALTYIPMLRHHSRPAPAALLLPAAAALYLAMTVDSARRHARGGPEWKGRRIRT